MRSLSGTALASAFSEDTDEVWLAMLTISHESLDDDIRVVKNNENIVSNGQTFLAYDFELELPEERPDRPGEARLRIDNTDKRIVEAVRSINSPPDVRIDIVLASDPDTFEVTFQDLKMRNVEYDVSFVTGTLVFEDIISEPIAVDLTPARFPGLF